MISILIYLIFFLHKICPHSTLLGLQISRRFYCFWQLSILGIFRWKKKWIYLVERRCSQKYPKYTHVKCTSVHWILVYRCVTWFDSMAYRLNRISSTCFTLPSILPSQKTKKKTEITKTSTTFPIKNVTSPLFICSVLLLFFS